ncbi:lysophospholipid acyltransferase family protein [Victivallis sp. Marseille-Q1083]|uniref:lysophospholipid acyltransferase family protein n=1 Tax=Victivallis sp. Marseille-Q1083 TaxID=2717288 RepID=UPI00158F43F5|nr:lysophospholipid acyltransferase family protein [Victivallis sp. Marseille-Q1083]
MAEKNMATAKRQKSAFRIWVEYIPVWLLYQFVHLLPLKVAYRLIRGIFGVMFYFDRKHRVRTVQHLMHAGVAPDERSARRMAKRVYKNFGMLFAEIVKMDQLFSVDKIRMVGDPESIRRLTAGPVEQRQNVIITTGHYGNWEVAGTAFAAFTGLPMTSLMRPFGNPLIGELILHGRRSKIHELVDKSGGIRPVLRALKAHRTVALLVDQHASRGEGVETVFFGQPCRTHTSPALLHLKTGIPILPQLTRRCGDNFEFELVVGKMIEYQPTGDREHDVRVIAQQYTSAFEEMVRQDPEQWMWAHRRWLNINRKSTASAAVENADSAVVK